jgi:hypothetical protein
MCEISSSHGGEYEAQNLLEWVIALMMEAARTSETLVDIQLRTRKYIPEDSELKNTDLKHAEIYEWLKRIDWLKKCWFIGGGLKHINDLQEFTDYKLLSIILITKIIYWIKKYWLSSWLKNINDWK